MENKKINIYYNDESGKRIEINEVILTSILIEQNDSFNKDNFNFYITLDGEPFGYWRRNLRNKYEFFYCE